MYGISNTFPPTYLATLGGRIRDMLLTFLRRWWLLNRLYHYLAARKLAWISEDTFIHHFTRLRKGSQSDLHQAARNLIHECTEDRGGPGYIARQDTNGAAGGVHLNLTGKGKEVYSLSYLIYCVLDYYPIRVAVSWAIPILIVFGLAYYFNIQITPR